MQPIPAAALGAETMHYWHEGSPWREAKWRFVEALEK
jgi:hypothetical protein